MEWFVMFFGIVLVLAAVVAGASIDKRLRDIRDVMIQSEDTVNRIAERFEDVDEVVYERPYRRN